MIDRMDISINGLTHQLDCSMSAKPQVHEGVHQPERVENCSTRWFANYRLKLEEQGIWLFFQRCVESSNGHNKS